MLGYGGCRNVAKGWCGQRVGGTEAALPMFIEQDDMMVNEEGGMALLRCLWKAGPLLSDEYNRPLRKTALP